MLELRDAYDYSVAFYEYDPWGKLLSVKDASGNAITSATHIANINPIRYRGYYYDTESGFYYLRSRYYDPEICRFISADNTLSTNDLLGCNLFAYCSNDPINRIDPTGDAWWHWALSAIVVVACAVATVATCGGFAAAASAVCLVASGTAAATTASTVAAAAFIGSATALGAAAVAAASTSNSVQEFADQGNWGTVATTVTAAVVCATSAYVSNSRSSANKTSQASSVSNTSPNSTGRTEPNNLVEKLSMEQVKSDPYSGTELTKIKLGDPRWLSKDGWVKMQQIIPTSQGDINIHYVYNRQTGVFDDFKFVP